MGFLKDRLYIYIKRYGLVEVTNSKDKGGLMARKITKTALKDKMDVIWGNIIKAMADNRCAVCEYLNIPSTIDKRYYGQSINAHHIAGKNCLRLRYDVRNGIALCVGHHRFGKLNAHDHGLWFGDILKVIRVNDIPYIKKHQTDIMSSVPLKYYLDIYEQLKLKEKDLNYEMENQR